jgi:DNA-binding PadR family transcriptional regulator
MQDGPRLTPTSYIVLGLVGLAGAATPYELKRAAAASLGNFWTLQHAQFYTEPQRLADAGLLAEEREEGGRLRLTYRLTAAGDSELARWRAEPTGDLGELREPALLKLFFGAPPAPLAADQLAAHRAKLATYEARREELAAAGAPPGPSATLEAGIAHEREWVRFWSERA